MERIKERTVRISRLFSPAALRRAGAFLAAGLLGFLLSDVAFEDEISPFAAAMTAGAPGLYMLPAGLGAAVGAFAFNEPVGTLKYVGAVMLILLFRFAAARLPIGRREQYAAPFIAFVCVLLSAAAVLFVRLPKIESVLLAFCEALISGTTAVFWRRVFLLLPDRSSLFAATPGDSAAFLFCGSLLLLSLTPLRFGEISPARILCFFLLMLFCLCAGEAAGAVSGICAGLALGFSGGQPHLIFALPAAGVLCGICRSLGKFAVAAAFLVTDALFLVLRGGEETAFAAAAEAGAAALVLLLLPRKFFDFAGERLRPFSKETYADESRALLRAKLGKMAGAVRDMSDAVSAVCRLLEKEASPESDPLSPEVRAAVCALCSKRRFCWEETGILTKKAFSEAEKAVFRHGRLFPEVLPARLATVCAAPERLCDAFNEKYSEFSARRAVRTELFDVKASAAEQFRTVSGLMLAAAEDVCGTRESEPYVKALLRGVFDAADFPYSEISVFTDEHGRCTAELICPEPPGGADYPALLEKIYTKTNLRFLPPVFSSVAPRGTAVTFTERPPLRVEFFKRSQPGGGERCCGDACEGFTDAAGNFCCVLSDGMGTGTEAAVNSAMTCALLSRLLRAGVRTDAAVTAVNAALLVNASEEMLATADVCRIDLTGGKADFLKAGAARSVIRIGAKTAVIERSSLPLGILRETKFEHSETPLSEGDAVIMMSDGADRLSGQFFKDLFYRRRGADAKELTAAVLQEAVRRAPIGRADDITVACMRILAAE